eukprot:jgi/Mesvir1/5508/Mv15549-RA.1
MDPVQERLMHADECILVDEQDHVVGHNSKLNCHLLENISKGTALHRAFSVFLFNGKNELLLQQRSRTKVTFPLVWTNTCCSHPLHTLSEMVEEGQQGVRVAAQRKLLDELGIEAGDAPVADFVFLTRILYRAPCDDKWGEHEVDYILFLQRDNVTTRPNPDEVESVRYVSRDQLKELVEAADRGQGGVTLSPWFRLIVDNFLYGWWDKLENGTLASAVENDKIHNLIK